MQKCEFCNKIVKDHLKRHQKTKKCMKIRLEKEKEKFKCKGCNMILANKKNLEKHNTTCLDYQLLLKDEFYQKQLEIKNQEILELKNLIKDLKKQSVSNIKIGRAHV